VTTDEDVPYVFAAADFGFTDPADNPDNLLAAVVIATLPAAGSLTLNGAAVAAGQSVAVADINAGLLVFEPDPDDNGAAYASFTFQVRDDGSNVPPNANLDPSANTITIDVTAVNDAPSGNLAGGAILYIENQAPTALDPALTVTDPDDTHLEGAQVAITGNFQLGQDVLGFTPQFGIAGNYNAATGVLTLAGTATLAQYETVLRSVTYFNSSQNPSDAARTVTFQVDDGGGLAGLGTVGVNVVPVIDPPNDLNGDAHSDVVWRADDGTVALWEMDGVNVLSSQAIAVIPNNWHIVDVDSDFGGDAQSDILWRNDDNTFVMWEMDGATIVENHLLPTLPAYWSVADTGDFGGDGRGDILWRDDAGRVVLWEMDGNATLANTLVADVPTTSHILDTADFTGDGRNDILWRDDDGTIRLWEMNGPNQVANTVLATLQSDVHFADVGDFNGDFRSDILWRNDAGTVTLWQMDGATILNATALGTLPNYWNIADVGDYTGDANSDILWRDDAGTIVLWEMNGPTIVDDSGVNTVATTWHIV
jgi:hypothetical protein